MQYNESEELELAAFRFVAGEMNAGEAATFELLLAEEQSAREAVCRAVAVSERVTLAGQQRVERRGQLSEPGRSSQSRVGRVTAALSWMAVGAVVASTMFILGGWGSQVRDPRFVEETEPRQLNASDDPNSEIDPLLIDGLVWSQIDATTQWNSDIDWAGEFSCANSALPRFDLPAPQQRSLFDHHHQPGEIE